MLLALLVQVVAAARLAQVHDPQLQRAAADLAGVVRTVAHIALVFVVYPENLVLPVLRVEHFEIIEKVDAPAARL